jgi:hypothetical protein
MAHRGEYLGKENLGEGRMDGAESARRAFRSWRSLAGALLFLIALGALAACGEASDNPEDCTAAEYYNEAQELCTACPAAVEPECRPGCGFRIAEDDNGCPVAECLQECKCGSGEFFSDDTFSCQSCEQADEPLLICAE